MSNHISPAYFRILRGIFQKLRIWKYGCLSDCPNVDSAASIVQPVLCTGRGKIVLGKCSLGVWPSPYYYSGYIHLEARRESASITIEDNVCINNNAVIIAEQAIVTICKNTLIGTNFTLYDSDFHEISPSRRLTGNPDAAPVTIRENVFIGSGVTVLKGVCIGENSIIASGAQVISDIPDNVIAGGVPARILRRIGRENR